MPLQKRFVQLGLGRQTSGFGHPVTVAGFRFGVQDGSAVTTEVNEPDLDTTWSTRLPEGFERLEVHPGMEYGFVATKQLVGQHLLAACGADVVTGGGPYLHTITENEPLPYFTGLALEGSSGDYFSVPNMKCGKLELSFEKTAALKGKATWMGTDILDSTTPWTFGADERVQDGYFNMGGGSFTIESASANIQKGTITYDQHLVPIPTATQVTPIDVFEAILTVEMAFTILPNDLGLWREIIFGSSSRPASGVSPVPHYGAVHQEWLSGADTLTFDTPSVKFLVNFPAADPAGGPVELEIEAKTAVNLAGNAYTWALQNETASY
jgi:hypothetical protein